MNGNFSESLQVLAYLLQVVLAITGYPPSSYWLNINLCPPNEFLTHTLNEAGGNGSRVSLLANSRTTSTIKADFGTGCVVIRRRQKHKLHQYIFIDVCMAIEKVHP